VITGRLHGQALRPPAAVAAAHGPIVLCDAAARPLVEYGAAFAVDARGARLPLATAVGADGLVRLEVPAAWLESAAFPLTIDPIVRTTLRNEPLVTGLVQTDIGRDDRANQLLIAYARKASATDTDLFLDLYDDAFNLLGTVFTDVTATWSNPRAAIAFVGGPDRFVTVVERAFADGRSGLRINLRDSGSTAIDNSLVFLDLPTGESHSHPDVGGIASGGTGDNALVVFQRAEPGTSTHEVLGFVVDARNRTLGTLNVMAGFGHGTTIDRRLPAVNQEARDVNDGWLVAYQEQNMAVANDDVDVLYVRVGNDGALTVATRVQSAFNSGTAHKMGPKVGGRDGKYTVAFTIDDTASRPAVPATPEGNSIVMESVRWAAGSAAGLGTDHLRRHVRTTRQWVADSVAFDTVTRTFWAVVFHNVVTGDCSISRHGFDAGEVDKQFLAEPGRGETGRSAAVCFDDDARAFKAVVVRDTATVSELVGAELTYSATAPVNFGTACGGRIDADGTPLAGSDSFVFELGQATANAPALLILGTRPAAVPLDFLGMQGCVLNVDFATAVTLGVSTTAFGAAAVPLLLPANPTPLTGRLVAQFAFAAPGQNTLGVLATGGVDVQIRQ
jgi:hypothetical protein